MCHAGEKIWFLRYFEFISKVEKTIHYAIVCDDLSFTKRIFVDYFSGFLCSTWSTVSQWVVYPPLQPFRVHANIFLRVYLLLLSLSLCFFVFSPCLKVYFCESFNAKWVLWTLYHLCVYLCVSVNMNQSDFHKKWIENDPDDKTRTGTKRIEMISNEKAPCGCYWRILI